MKKYIICFIASLYVFALKAQVLTEPCGYMKEVEKILKRQPNFLVWQNAMIESAMSEYTDMQGAKRRIIADTVYYQIPVVFHVLYHDSINENINVSYINSQLNELNLAFRKMTADTQRIRPIFSNIAADVRIQFVLATKDPNGNPTSGITRTYTSKTTFATNAFGAYNDDMKYTSRGGKNAWNPTRYLNIWTCNMRFPNQQSMTLGFATPPTGAPNWWSNVTKDSTDVESGVVLHYSIVGRNNPLAIANNVEGKTAIHEVGHYLGLRHVWGDGNAQNGCTVDDGIFDTPNARDKNYTCSKTNPPNTCTDPVNDLPDQTENYMDYALDGCAAMFTKQQAYLMRYVLNNFRTGLPSREITHDTLFDNTTVEMYPNPLKQGQDLKFQISSPQKQQFTVQIIDMSGKQVLKQTITSNAIEHVKISGLANSVYYVIISDAGNRVLERKKLLIF